MASPGREPALCQLYRHTLVPYVSVCVGHAGQLCINGCGNDGTVCCNRRCQSQTTAVNNRASYIVLMAEIDSMQCLPNDLLR